MTPKEQVLATYPNAYVKDRSGYRGALCYDQFYDEIGSDRYCVILNTFGNAMMVAPTAETVKRAWSKAAKVLRSLGIGE